MTHVSWELIRIGSDVVTQTSSMILGMQLKQDASISLLPLAESSRTGHVDP